MKAPRAKKVRAPKGYEIQPHHTQIAAADQVACGMDHPEASCPLGTARWRLASEVQIGRDGWDMGLEVARPSPRRRVKKGRKV